MDSLISQIYINYILKDDNVSLIEVWDNKLFVWKYKGSPTFRPSLQLTFDLPIYYRPNEYKQLSRKYHPDLSNSKSSRVLSGVIQASINDNKEILDVQDRGYNASFDNEYFSKFDRILSCSDSKTRNNLTRELSTGLYDSTSLVQDSFIGEEGSYVNLVQEMAYPETRREGFEERWEQQHNETIQRLAAIEIARYNLPTSHQSPSESEPYQLTRYGYDNELERSYLRHRYGNVFRVYVGGPIDNGPPEKKRRNRRKSNKNVGK
jgi:hypothetical protein